MDIELLSKIVGELILKHNQVGLPGIGTFVAEMVPASFTDKGYTINPPYRRLSFYTANLEEDILIDFYSESNRIDREAAKSYLKLYFSDLKAVLLERRTVVFPGLGRMRTTKDDQFFFVPNEDLDIFPEGFGLVPVSLKTHVETPEEIAISVSNLANIIDGGQDALEQLMPLHRPEPEELPEITRPETEAEPESDVAPAAALQEPAGCPATATATVTVEEDDDEPSPKKKFNFWIFLLVLIGIAFVAAAVFMVLAVVAPDFIDSLLYTPEELRIINY